MRNGRRRSYFGANEQGIIG
ncbi:hypothetical protein LINPERHAP1_LOCUS39114 [Linum perenne]